MSHTARALVLIGALAGCGSDPAPLVDGGADAAPAFDGSTADATAPDAPVASDGPGGAGACVLTLSKLVGSNAANTTVTFPYMFVTGKGETCNAATAPTLCSVDATDNGTQTSWTIYQQPESFADGTTMPIIAAIATQPGTAIAAYQEGQNRWDATSGTVTIDHQSGHLISLHAVAQMAADTTHTLATGTFQLDVVCTEIDFQP